LSVSDKTGLADLGRGLAARGFELVSTGGTAKTLVESGLPVTGVSDLTGLPEMLDGRVKTLHPAVHGGILARRHRADDLAALDRHGFGLIDVVVVNLYPFARVAADPAAPFDVLLEHIDIGGPSLARAAAKNFDDVLVVVDPADYPRLLAALDDTPSAAFRFELARKAFAHTAAYDAAIAETLATIETDGTSFRRRSRDAGAFPVDLTLRLQKGRDLQYGENPHQRAASYGLAQDASGFGGATRWQGQELSYTNLLDLDAALSLVLEFDDVAAAAVVKHTNPCGVAIGGSPADAYLRARDADAMSAFGGAVALNRTIDLAAAEAITSSKINAVVAPAVTDEARAALARRPNMRVVTIDIGPGPQAPELRSILGAIIAQDPDRVAEARRPWGPAGSDNSLRVVTRRGPTAAEWEAMRFAWRVCAHVKSNAVVFTTERTTLAIGAGQMSRVDAAMLAVMKARQAQRSLAGSVAASDAYFPFRDGLDAVAQAGATAVVQPGGSLRDPEVIAAADEHGLAMVFTGRRHFKH
jgi:phosphoribosylaminoimidazolecarboxamide formyltransferase/IMP cyclohydrolase